MLHKQLIESIEECFSVLFEFGSMLQDIESGNGGVFVPGVLPREVPEGFLASENKFVRTFAIHRFGNVFESHEEIIDGADSRSFRQSGHHRSGYEGFDDKVVRRQGACTNPFLQNVICEKDGYPVPGQMLEFSIFSSDGED